MASAARMVLKPSSHSSITGRRRCSHSNVAGGWTLLRTLGGPLTVARCSSSPRRCDSCELHHAGLTRNGLVSRACGTLADERGPERDSCASPEVTALSPFRVTYSWTHPRAVRDVQRVQCHCQWRRERRARIRETFYHTPAEPHYFYSRYSRGCLQRAVLPLPPLLQVLRRELAVAATVQGVAVQSMPV